MAPREVEKLSDQDSNNQYLSSLTESGPKECRKYSKDEQSLIRDQIKNLDPVETKVIYLKFWKDFDLPCIAVQLNKRIDYIERVYAKSLEKLKFYYEKKLSENSNLQKNHEEKIA